MKPFRLLNFVVAVIGVGIVILGLNIGLGGIRTLGWQATRDFVTITNAAVYSVQDSHIRFIGGVWFGVGLAFLAGGFALDRLRRTLIVLCAMIALAGLFRFSALDVGTFANAAILPSLILELLGFPLLALWLARAGLTTQPIEQPIDQSISI